MRIIMNFLPQQSVTSTLSLDSLTVPSSSSSFLIFPSTASLPLSSQSNDSSLLGLQSPNLTSPLIIPFPAKPLNTSSIINKTIATVSNHSPSNIFSSSLSLASSFEKKVIDFSSETSSTSIYNAFQEGIESSLSSHLFAQSLFTSNLTAFFNTSSSLFTKSSAHASSFASSWESTSTVSVIHDTPPVLHDSDNDDLENGFIDDFLAIFETKSSPKDLSNHFLENNSTKHENLFAVSILEALGLAIPTLIIMLFTIIGNVLVILAIFTYRPLKNVQNMYLVSLAVADITVAVFVMPFNVIYTLRDRWDFGLITCKIWVTCDILCCTASILNLCAIAIDRYQAIHDPINYAQKRTLKRVLTGVALVWIISALISIPPLLGWNDWSEEFTPTTPCMLTSERSFVIYSSSGSFFIPLVIMSIVYVKIYVATRRRLRSRAKTAATKMTNLKSVCTTQVAGDEISDPDNPAQDQHLETNFGGDKKKKSRNIIMFSKRKKSKTGHNNNNNGNSKKNKSNQLMMEGPTSGTSGTKTGSSSSEKEQREVKMTQTDNIPFQGREEKPSTSSSSGDHHHQEREGFDSKGKPTFTSNGSKISKTRKEVAHQRENRQPKTSSASRVTIAIEKNTTSVSSTDSFSSSSSSSSGNQTQGREQLQVRENDSLMSKTTSTTAAKTTVSPSGIIVPASILMREGSNRSKKFSSSSVTSEVTFCSDHNDRNTEKVQGICDENTLNVDHNRDAGGQQAVEQVLSQGQYSMKTSQQEPQQEFEKLTARTEDVIDRQQQYIEDDSGEDKAEDEENVDDFDVEAEGFTRQDVKYSLHRLSVPSSAKLSCRTSSSSHDESSKGTDSSRSRNKLMVEGESSCGASSIPASTGSTSVLTQVWEEKQRISLSRERKAARVLGIVMGVFVACWLPFFLMYVIVPFSEHGIARWLENVITWLGYINSALNPIIYTIFNLDFRRAFQKILGCQRR